MVGEAQLTTRRPHRPLKLLSKIWRRLLRRRKISTLLPTYAELRSEVLNFLSLETLCDRAFPPKDRSGRTRRRVGLLLRFYLLLCAFMQNKANVLVEFY